jgi:hypothetical protein
VGADDGRVEDQEVQFGVAQGGEERVPAAFLSPAVEAPPLTVAVAQALGEVGPRGAGAGDPQDRIKEATVVLGNAAVLASLSGQQVLDTFPISIGDGVAMAHERPSVAFDETAAYPDCLPRVHTT